MPKKNLSTRAYFNIEDIEIRKNDETNTITARGYAAVFDKLSVPLYNFREKIQKGAFTKTLTKNNVRALWNHNSDYVLGSTKGNTLRLQEDDKGLKFELDLPDSTIGRDAAVAMKRGDVDGMSFGFRTLKQAWDESNPENVIRTLIEVDLQEISPTPFPAYPATNVKVRSVQDEYNEYKEQTAAQELEKNSNELTLKMRRIDAL